MTMPHLMNCAHSETGWCLECVKDLHDECHERADTLDKLLSDIGFFETTADPGPGREVEGVSVRLWYDGSGELLVETAATTDKPGVQAMLNRVFNTQCRIPFENIGELYSILKNIDALKPKHPEAT